MQASLWWLSFAIRLPSAVVKALDLHPGDEAEVSVLDERRFELVRKAPPLELLQRLRPYRGRLPADFKFDRLEAQERA